MAKKRIEKYNRLHPKNQLDTEQLSALWMPLTLATKEVNSWISMVTATMQLHPEFEGVVKDGIRQLEQSTYHLA